MVVAEVHDRLPFFVVCNCKKFNDSEVAYVCLVQVPKLASAAEYFFKLGVEGKRFRPTVRSPSLATTMMKKCMFEAAYTGQYVIILQQVLKR